MTKHDIVGVVTNVGFRRHAIESVLQLELMGVDWDVSTTKVIESTSMIQVQMSHDDRLDVFDVIASLANSCVELVIFYIILTCEDVVQLWTPHIWIVFPSAGFEQD